MAIITLKVTKNNNKSSITINKTQNENFTISGSIYQAEEVLVNTLNGYQDASNHILNSLGVLVFSKETKTLKDIKAKTDAYFAEKEDRYPNVGIKIEGEVQLTPSGTVLIKNVSLLDIERPEEIVSLEDFQAVANAKRQERNISWAMKISNIFGGVVK